MTFKSFKHLAQLIATFSIGLMAVSAHAATPMGCEAKGALYILENGVQTVVPVTPGAGTTAAASNQGHAGFKTDVNGLFTLSYPLTPLTPTQTYYFRMETRNGQYLAYGIPGQFGNTFKTMAQPVKGQIVCGDATPSQVAGVNLGAPILTANTIAECSAVNVGRPCGQWFKFSPTYHAAPGYEAAQLSSYPTVPKCSSANASSLTPATVLTGSKSGCMRRFWVNRMAAPNPGSKWVSILDLNSWQVNATPQNLVIGEQIAN